LVHSSLWGGTEEEVADVFLRLQEGQPLNTPERLNAIQTEMKNFVIDLSRLPTFKNSKIDPWRFSHQYLAAQCVYFCRNSDLRKKEFPNPPRYEDLADMYSRGTRISKGLRTRVRKTLDFIYNCLQDEIKVINKKSDVIVLFMLAHYVRTHYVVQPEIFRRAVTNFITEVENAQITNRKPKTPYEEYKVLRKAGATKENFKRKFELMLRDFEKLNTFVKKDTRRFPNLGQKLRVYYRDKRTCTYCGKFVKFDQISIDHVVPHSKGGPTDIKNLRLVHKGRCHKELEKRKR
jgi:hypothetical protein